MTTQESCGSPTYQQGRSTATSRGVGSSGRRRASGNSGRKPYTVRLAGADVTPEEVVRLWKREFPIFHPPESRFYPSLDGVEPGEIILINASVQGMPVYTGVMILYSDDVSFTVMTAEGLPEAGWKRMAQRGPQVRQIHDGLPGPPSGRVVSPSWQDLGARIRV